MASEWREVELREAFEINPRREIKRGQLTPFIPMDALPEHTREVTRVDEREFTGSGTKFKNGDILFARITPSLENGKTAYISRLPEGVIAHGSTEYIIVAERPGVSDGLFGYYLARSPEFRTYAITHMEGTSGRQRVPHDAIASFRISLPPLPEQRAIAHILGTLDDKIELNRRMNETLEAMARALFKSWFVDFLPVRAKAEGRWKRGQSLPGLPAHLYDLFPDSFEDSELGEIPKGWGVGTLGELCQKPQYGYTASTKAELVGPRFLRITDINKLPWVNWMSVPYCEISTEDYEKYRVQTGDVLIARMADPGHGVLIEESVDAVFASYLIRFRPKDVEYSRYIQYWLRSPIYWELVNARSAGTTRANLNAKVLGALPLLIPDRAIVSAFRNVIESLRSKVAANVTQSNTLATVRDTLLPKLLSGEIRVSEAKEAVEETV